MTGARPEGGSTWWPALRVVLVAAARRTVLSERACRLRAALVHRGVTGEHRAAVSSLRLALVSIAVALAGPWASEAGAQSVPPSGRDAATGAPEEVPAEPEDGLAVRARIGGTYQLRGNAMSDVPLRAPGDGSLPAELGQNYWGEQWLRLRAEISLSERRDAEGNPVPLLRLVGETDLLFGVAFGELAIGTRPAAWGRDAFGYPGIRLRHLYLEWFSDAGVLRVGQMGFSWGLGIVANDGSTPPPFGDARFGDLVRRVLFATRPFGTSSPLHLAIAADWVAWDLLADFDRPCAQPGLSGGTGFTGCGDLAFQGLVAAYYEEGESRLGGYVAYRHQDNHVGDDLRVFAIDLFGRFVTPEPSGGNFFVAAEGALFLGSTSMTRTAERPRAEVQQLLVAAQLGRTGTHFDLIVEGGYASGDSNPEDGAERRGTMDPDHRIGLVLFPEVLAMMSARAAFLAEDPVVGGRPPRGSALLPTNGGVSGAFYFFPHLSWRPLDWIDVRLGGVLAFASADVVDPYAQRLESRSVNFRGGDPTQRDFGFEVDASVLMHGALSAETGVELNGGIEGGLLVPGRAFDDAMGGRMGEVGLVRARVGLRY